MTPDFGQNEREKERERWAKESIHLKVGRSDNVRQMTASDMVQ